MGGEERLTTAAESVAMVLIDWRRGKPLPARALFAASSSSSWLTAERPRRKKRAQRE